MRISRDGCVVFQGFELLKREWAEAGKPSRGAEAKLTKLMQFGGSFRELRAEKLKDIARWRKADLGGI